MTQPYDSYLKSIASDDPRALYYLLQRLPPPPGALIHPIVQELTSKKIIIDCGFLVEINGRKRVDIFEFKAGYANSARKQILDYALMVYLAKNLPVECTLVIVYPYKLPRSYTDLPPLRIPGLLSITFRTVKLWEIDAERVLSAEKPHLLSVLPLVKTNQTQMVEGARRVFQTGSVDAQRWFWELAKLRYNQSGVERLFEDAEMNAAIMEKIINEIYPLSPLGKRQIREARKQARQEGLQEGLKEGLQEGLEKGLKKGLEKGLEEGRLTEASDTIRRVLARQFPSYEIPAKLSFKADLAALRAAEDAVFEAKSVAEAEKIIAQLLSGKPK